jgi:hypothetical protein
MNRELSDKLKSEFQNLNQSLNQLRKDTETRNESVDRQCECLSDRMVTLLKKGKK